MDIKFILNYYQQKFDAKIFELKDLPQYYNDFNIGCLSLKEIYEHGIYCQSECIMPASYIKYCLLIEDKMLVDKQTYNKYNLLNNGLPILKGTILFILIDKNNEIEFSIDSCLDLSKEELEKCFYI